MIDWFALIFNSLWVLGLAVILAAASFHHWNASRHHTSLRTQFQQQSFAAWGWLGLTLIALGLAGTSQPLWQQLLWSAFAIINAIFAYQAWRAWFVRQDNAEKFHL